jgi:hypothetical protein
MLNVSRVINSPQFQQAFTVIRNHGTFDQGRWDSVTEELNFSGIITPLSTKDINQLPEGDAIKGGISVYSTEPIYTTRLTSTSGSAGGVSDEITWQGEQWRVMSVQQFSDYGYYKATAVRKKGT